MDMNDIPDDGIEVNGAKMSKDVAAELLTADLPDDAVVATSLATNSSTIG